MLLHQLHNSADPIESANLATCLPLCAAVSQNAQSQIQSFPAGVRLPDQAQEQVQSTLTPEPRDGRPVTLDVVSAYGHQGAPLGHMRALVVSLMFRFGEMSEAPGQRQLRVTVFARGCFGFSLCSTH